MGYEAVVRVALERGFFSPSCEIYSDAPAGFWEYGPLGLALRKRYEELWRRHMVRRDGMIEIDGSQVMSKNVFVASGHLESFVDPSVTCKKCGAISRADKLISEKTGQFVPEKLSESEFDQLIAQHSITCPVCGGNLGPVRKFNMMFRLGVGAREEDAYLRPETCQSIFVDFPRLFKVMRCKLPIGFAQFGKVFRNEISARQSLIRLREFYQAEMEIFFNSSRANDFAKFEEIERYPLRMMIDSGETRLVECGEAMKKHILPSKLVAYYLAILQQFYERTGIDMKKSRFRKLTDEERAFYSQFGLDFEVETSLGWIELVACNYRTDYDLSRHAQVSGKGFSVLDDGGKVDPHVFELSMGVDRSIYCILEHCSEKEPERDVLRLKPYLAAIQVGIFPLVNRDGLPEKAKQIYAALKYDFDAVYDDSGSIGRRYRRVDEIGTPFCLTVDYQSLEDGTVTIRERDTMKQVRIAQENLLSTLTTLLRGEPFSHLIQG